MNSSAPNLIFIRDPRRSGFFTQTPGSSDLTWISDPSTSGFFMESSPAPSPPSSPPLVPASPEAAEETHRILIRTTKSGLARKIFKDHLGLYVAYFPNPFDEADWLRDRARILGFLPRELVAMEFISVKLSSRYQELKAEIDRQVPEEENRFERIALRGRPSVEKVRLGGVAVVWGSNGEEKGYTLINANNCLELLGLIAKRGYKDCLVALYENI